MFQNGFKRFYDSFVGIPDRTPFIAQMHEFAMKWTKVSAKKFYTDPEILVKGIIDTAYDFKFDVPWLGYDVYNIEPEAIGIPVSYSENLPPEVSTNCPLINTPDDLYKIDIPNPYSSARMPYVLEANKQYEKATGYSPPIQFTAPFSLAVTLRGFQNLLLDIYSRPDFAHEILDFVTSNILAPWINAMKKNSPNATLFRGADAMASIPLINMDILKEYAVSYIIKLKNLCDKNVAVVNWWGESHLKNPNDMLSEKLIISPDIIQGQDPDVEKIGPELYKNFSLNHDVALILGIGNSFLQNASKEKIRSRVVHYIKAGAVEGRFMLYLCYLSSETPPENVREAISAIKEYGIY